MFVSDFGVFSHRRWGWKEGKGLTGDFQATNMILTREFEAELLRISSDGLDIC